MNDVEFDELSSVMEVRVLHETLSSFDHLDLDTLDPDERHDITMGLMAARHRIEALTARHAHRWSEDNIWTSDGSRGASARLARDGHTSPDDAKKMLRTGHAAAQMAAADDAWRAGDLSAAHIDLLSAARRGREDAFARDEWMLVGYCEHLRYPQAVKRIAYWKHEVDRELEREGSEAPDPSAVTMSTTHDGHVTGTIHLDPIGGATFSAALDRIEHEFYLADQAAAVDRPVAERRAAALVEMAIRATTVPADGRRPQPLISILVGAATLDHLCELANGTVLAPDLVMPEMTTALMQSFVFDDAHMVLSASTQRTFTGRLRRAIQVRDRHCQHPSGCDVPITRCDVDHITPYRDGGITDEQGGRLQCPTHNRRRDLHDRDPEHDLIDEARERRRDALELRRLTNDLIAGSLARQRAAPSTAPPPAA